MSKSKRPAGSAAPSLLERWAHARAAGLNNRAAALQLGVSEAALVASACGRFATRLRPECATLLGRLAELGEIKCVVRNAYAVLERTGTVQRVELLPPSRVRVQADRFEAECRPQLWRKAFALDEASPHGVKRSLQFFSAEGVSTAKFFLRAASDERAYGRLVATCADDDQSSEEDVAPAQAAALAAVEGLSPTARDALLHFLESASRARHALHLRVHNAAAALGTSKIIERVKRSDRGGWVNVLDEGLDLHLDEDRIRFVQPVPGSAPDSGWFHWFAGPRELALSAHVDTGWNGLARALGVGSSDPA